MQYDVSHLVHPFVVGLDGLHGAGGVVTVLKVTVVGRLTAVRIKVFP